MHDLTPHTNSPSELCETVEVSVVIATRDRPGGITAVLKDLQAQEGDRRFEVVVVDDGSQPPLRLDPSYLPEATRLLRTPGGGPASARNAGWRAARAPLIMFTDDDVRIAPGWVDAACRALGDNPEAVTVEGPVETPPFDPLFEYSLAVSDAGAGLTCNIAYRRSALQRVSGFDEGFPFPHCEDVDLLFRASLLGSACFAPGMRIVHQPRPMSVADFARRGEFAASELRLFRRHRDRYPARIPVRVLPLLYCARRWAHIGYLERWRLILKPRRGTRWLLASVRQLVSAELALRRAR